MMSYLQSAFTNTLDRIRLENGIDHLKNTTEDLIRTNKDNFINLINDQDLHFTSLFLLRSEMEESQMFSSLNLRNRIALTITDEILKSKQSNKSLPCSSCDYIQRTASTLQWMLETGVLDDGLNDLFDEVLDTTAILLTKVYKDKSVLPIITNMIFKRYKKSSLIHDLVWAFFESKDPDSLVLIANYLKSSDPEERQLAQKLLNFVPNLNIHDTRTSSEKQYSLFLHWLKENRGFLYYTGESFQQCPNPMPYAVILEAKYLCKTVSTTTGHLLEILTDNDYKQLNEFKKLNETNKVLLADFSCALNQSNPTQWKTWIHYPMMEQLAVAKTRWGVIR